MLLPRNIGTVYKNQNNHNPQLYVAARREKEILNQMKETKLKINKAIITQTDKGNKIIILKED
jgi:hypothetical protein